MFSTGRIDFSSGNISDSFSPLKISRWRAVQRKLAQKVIRRDCFSKPPKYVAGIDVAYQGETAFGAVVVLDYKTLEIVESTTAESMVENPYIPSFLAFRELKPMTNAIKRLKKRPDVFLVNAHGIAHPERCGCASHLGVVLDVPTIGVAKAVLIGEVSDLDDRGIGYLKDRGEIIGAAMVSKIGCKPIYVSVGHKVSFGSAIAIVSRTTRENRIPEPLRFAHRLSNSVKASAQ